MSILISVITPMCNDRDSILQAIESVQVQTISELEHIIVDDGSSDGAPDLVREAQSRYPNLRLIVLGENRGAAIARNVGIEAAQGRYIAFLDSDDLWDPGKLRTQISFMEQAKCALSYGSYRVVNKHGKGGSAVYRAPNRLTYRRLLLGCPIGCLTVVYDTRLCGKIFMPLVRRGQDWGLWLKIIRTYGPALRYNGVLASYRIGDGSLSSKKFSKVADVWRLYREQEGINTLRAAAYLIMHMAYSTSRGLGIRMRMRF